MTDKVQLARDILSFLLDTYFTALVITLYIWIFRNREIFYTMLMSCIRPKKYYSLVAGEYFPITELKGRNFKIIGFTLANNKNLYVSKNVKFLYCEDLMLDGCIVLVIRKNKIHRVLGIGNMLAQFLEEDFTLICKWCYLLALLYSIIGGLFKWII